MSAYRYSEMTAGACFRAAFLSLLVLLAAPSSYADQRGIPVADNLAELGHLSLQQDIPVIVFVSRDACPYCRTLREQILKPMLTAGKFEQRAILAEVSLDRNEPLTGFENSPMTAQAFAEDYQAGITPTLLFLDSRGLEISKRRVGISNLELYGYYLQKSIDEALQAIRSEEPKG
jgi:thioredoxin-related protein